MLLYKALCVYLTFQHLSILEARGNVTEYQAFTLHDANKADVDGCSVTTAVRAPGSQNFIRWQLPTDSSYHLAVTAYTAAGCNSSLAYSTLFIPTQKQRTLHYYTADPNIYLVEPVPDSHPPVSYTHLTLPTILRV